LGKVSFAFWICPTLILLTGLYVILRPMETATLSLQILGWCSLLYGVTELINSLQIWRIRKMAEKTAQQKQNFGNETVAEEISSEINTDEQA